MDPWGQNDLFAPAHWHCTDPADMLRRSLTESDPE